MDQETMAFFDERLRELTKQVAEETARQFAVSRDETSQQIEKLREETISRFEKVEETARHNGVLIEGLGHKLDVVAEGVMAANERLDRYHTETKAEFNQVKGLVKPYYRELDKRVRKLNDRASLTDGRIEGLDGRLQVLENRAERQRGDVFDAIRKMLGKPPLSPPVKSE